MNEDMKHTDGRSEPDLLQSDLARAVQQVRSDPPPLDVMHRALERVRKLDAPASGHRPLLKRGALAAAAIAAVFAVVAWWNSGASEAWAQIAQAVEKKPWIRGVSDVAGKGRVEFWLSPAQATSAVRFGQEARFFDHRLQIYYSYDPAKQELYRLPEAKIEAGSFAAVHAMSRALLRGDTKLGASHKDVAVVSQKRRSVEEAGRTWEEHELTFRHEALPGRPVVLVFRVDPETKLPRSMRVAGREPQAPGVEFALDYPETGPADVYALGVPPTAKLIDRVPQGDLTRCLDALQAGRQRFDPYQVLVVESLVQKDKSEEIMMLTLVWRDGQRWRMERGVSKEGWGIAPPKEWPEQNTDLIPWLKEYASSLRFVPWIVCDGRGVYVSPNLSGKPKVQRIMDAPGDTGVGPAWAHLPEVYAYPPSIQRPAATYEVGLDANPKHGPAKTVMLFGRHTGADQGAYPFARAWVDPSRNYLAQRWELLAHPEDEAAAAQGDGKFGTVDRYDLESVARSPRGIWFPTMVRRRRVNATEAETRVYRFFVNFKAPMRDGLFQMDKGD